MSWWPPVLAGGPREDCSGDYVYRIALHTLLQKFRSGGPLCLILSKIVERCAYRNIPPCRRLIKVKILYVIDSAGVCGE